MSCLPFTFLPFCSKKCTICNKSHNRKEIKIASKKDNTVNINSFANVTFPTFELLFNNIKQEVYKLLNEENNVSKLDRVIISYKIRIIEDMYRELVSYLYFELRNISDCNIYCFTPFLISNAQERPLCFQISSFTSSRIKTEEEKVRLS